MFVAATRFPVLDGPARAARVQRWSAGLLRALGVYIETRGAPPPPGAAMLVANHVSWLDIFVLNTHCPARFVAKSEVRAWPLIGWLCERAGTLFIRRARRHHTAHINAVIAAALSRGETFAVFPEGTTTAGDRVLPFHGSLLEPAIAAGVTVYPAALRYVRADGSLCGEADYAGERSLLESLWLIVSQPGITARLVFLPGLPAAGSDRRTLAQEAGRVIATALTLPAPARGAGTGGGPPDAAR